MASDDMPSLAGLRRRGAKPKVSQGNTTANSSTPSLFDWLGEEAAAKPEPETPKLPEPAPRLTAKEAAESQPRAQVWSVAALVREVRGLVERSYGQVTVEGEISNWKPAGSGHCYFTLKDGEAQLAAVMFRRSASMLRFRPKDGDSVRLRGQVSVYENRGQMQLIVETMELAGQGALLAAVQQLKERLRREGLFDRKRPIPPFPRCIGIITSLQGAALRDIVKVCRRRHAAVNLLIYPVSVQGPRCPADVIAGLRWFNRHGGHADVILVARGGGSWEDLHGFDDEGVARAIVACTVPVVSGIGHATDTTIADAAADVCAPTPSAAAEMVTAAQHRVEDHVERLRSRVLRAGKYELLRARQRLWNAGSDASLRSIHDTLRRRAQWIDELGFRAEAGAARALRLYAERLTWLEGRLQQQSVALRLAANGQRLEQFRFRLGAAASSRTAERRGEVGRITARLEALSPLRVLDRGYALVYSPEGRLLRSSQSVREGDALIARLAEGSVEARVTHTNSTTALNRSRE